MYLDFAISSAFQIFLNVEQCLVSILPMQRCTYCVSDIGVAYKPRRFLNLYLLNVQCTYDFFFQIIFSIDILSSDLILLKQIRNINRYILVHVFKARHWFTMYYELTICIFDLKETCMISIWAMIIQSINKWSINLKIIFQTLKPHCIQTISKDCKADFFWKEWRWDDIDIDQCFTLLTWFFFPANKTVL